MSDNKPNATNDSPESITDEQWFDSKLDGNAHRQVKAELASYFSKCSPPRNVSTNYACKLTKTILDNLIKNGTNYQWDRLMGDKIDSKKRIQVEKLVLRTAVDALKPPDPNATTPDPKQSLGLKCPQMSGPGVKSTISSFCKGLQLDVSLDTNKNKKNSGDLKSEVPETSEELKPNGSKRKAMTNSEDLAKETSGDQMGPNKTQKTEDHEGTGQFDLFGNAPKDLENEERDNLAVEISAKINKIFTKKNEIKELESKIQIDKSTVKKDSEDMVIDLIQTLGLAEDTQDLIERIRIKNPEEN